MDIKIDNDKLFGFQDFKEEQYDVNAIIEKVKSVVQSIVNGRFPDNLHKRQIEVTKREILMACPCCGDSKTNSKEKRGHIYFKNLAYKCWNGGCDFKYGSITRFLEHFGKKDEFSEGELRFLKKFYDGHTVKNDDFNRISFNPIVKPKQVDEYAIPREHLKKVLKLAEIEDNEYVKEYLRGRNQLRSDMSHMLCDRYGNDIWLLNLSSDRKGVFGIQIRHSNVKKSGRRFTTHQYSDIWFKLLDTEVKDELKQRLDRLSLIYNIMLVDFSQPTFVFEGTMDANHLKNSVATWSANTIIRLPKGYYFYDNTTIDKAGYDASMQMLSEGFNVFLWKKFIEDNESLADCKDLDDVLKRKKFTIDNLIKYFGNSFYDTIYL